MSIILPSFEEKRLAVISEAQEKVRTFYKANGRRPVHSDGKEWARLGYKLEKMGGSLARVSDSVGAPRLSKDRSTIQIADEVIAFVKEHGRHPTVSRDPEFSPHDKWLRRRGSSLSWFCKQLGYESPVGGDRRKAR